MISLAVRCFVVNIVSCLSGLVLVQVRIAKVVMSEYWFFNLFLNLKWNFLLSGDAVKLIQSIFLFASAAVLVSCGGNAAHEQTANKVAMYSPAPSASSQNFSGLRANYTIRNALAGFVVTEISTGKAVVIDAAIINLIFADSTVNLVVAKKAKTIPAKSVQQVEELYVAFFNRVPDANGLAYWIDQVAAGTSINQIAESFYAAALYYSSATGYVATMSNSDFIKIVYMNVLGRTTVDEGGMAYWSKSLADGTQTRGSLVSTILYSAHTYKGDATYGYVADLLDNKLQVADYFAVQQGLNYNTEADSISNGMLIASKVTPLDTNAAKNLIKVGVDATGDLFNAPAVVQGDVKAFLALTQACPNVLSRDSNASTCIRASLVGYTTFGKVLCTLTIDADGKIAMLSGTQVLGLKKPYNVYFNKATAISTAPNAYVLDFMATDYGSTTGQSFKLSLKSPGEAQFHITPSLTAEVSFLSDFSKNLSCSFDLPAM